MNYWSFQALPSMHMHIITEKFLYRFSERVRRERATAADKFSPIFGFPFVRDTIEFWRMTDDKQTGKGFRVRQLVSHFQVGGVDKYFEPASVQVLAI